MRRSPRGASRAGEDDAQDVGLLGRGDERAECEQVTAGGRDFTSIPNLLYKVDGDVRTTGFSHKPATDYNNVRNDWTYYQNSPVTPLSSKLIMKIGRAHV